MILRCERLRVVKRQEKVQMLVIQRIALLEQVGDHLLHIRLAAQISGGAAPQRLF